MAPLANRDKRKLLLNRLGQFKALVAKHGAVCWYCQAPITFESCELDHIQAKSRGGRHRLTNLALSCLSCNRAKRDLPLKDFLAWLTRPKKPLPHIVQLAKLKEGVWSQYGEDIEKGLRKIEPNKHGGRINSWVMKDKVY